MRPRLEIYLLYDRNGAAVALGRLEGLRLRRRELAEVRAGARQHVRYHLFAGSARRTGECKRACGLDRDRHTDSGLSGPADSATNTNAAVSELKRETVVMAFLPK